MGKRRINCAATKEGHCTQDAGFLVLDFGILICSYLVIGRSLRGVCMHCRHIVTDSRGKAELYIPCCATLYLGPHAGKPHRHNYHRFR